jgi:hypothetical protein
MNGDVLAQRLREILHDKETATDKGTFWDDRQLRLALNAAQDVIINRLLNNKQYSNLLGLATQTTYGRNTVVPWDYLHYMSGQVGDTEQTLKLARVYLGATGDAYINVNHYAVCIIGNAMMFVNKGERISSGILYYYKRPSFIGLTSMGDDSRSDFNTIDFAFDIYDMIVQHSAQILGMKETQTQREFKLFKNLNSELSVQPIDMVNISQTQEIPTMFMEQK